ncbi:MAG: Mu transposase C-terminal domain-containing protein [Loktanella sp.]|nr:Mu transposase C-terminal domain-containing protein [Loktanella sp.]
MDEGLRRFAVLRPHIEEGISLSSTARAADVPIRTAQRWLSRYREQGLEGLKRRIRSDGNKRKLPEELVRVIEGLALRKPRLSCAAIHRRIAAAAKSRGWPIPSYGTVHSITRALDPAMVTLAQEGAAAYRDRYELIYRHRASIPNAIWQADHTMLDTLIVDANGKVARPWLTAIMDDHSRAIAGYMVFLGAPSALQTSLALRQAIWRKQNPDWPVCGIPDVLYVDHGSDFTSEHLDQASAALRFQLVYSAVARPQGRGKIERFFGTLNTELLPDLPGNLVDGRPTTPPKLSLSELDTAIGIWITGTYNSRRHSETGISPVASWCADGWLPQLPDSLESLDQLLVMVAKPRMVRRDGVHFQGLRYMSPTLAPYVGENVTVRYDPRDLGEVRVFHKNRFLCRAISPDHAHETVTLKDIQTARSAHRRALRQQINERVRVVAEYLPGVSHREKTEPDLRQRRTSKLRTYWTED